MYFRHVQPPPEDPSVAPVEEILEAAACHSIGEPALRDGRLVVTHAIWLCACKTIDESPVWLVYTVGKDGIGWQRIPAGVHIAEVVEAEHLTGGHPAPEGVLEWLRSEGSAPLRELGGFPVQTFIFEEFRRRIRST